MVTAIPYRKLLESNSTATSFSEVEISSTEPSGAGVLDLRGLGWSTGVFVPSYLEILFYGVGSDTQTYDTHIYGLTKTNDTTPLYAPALLADLTCALGPTTGCDGAAIETNGLLVDTITTNEGPAAPWVDVITTGDNTPASVILHTRGHRYIKFVFDMTGATSANAYIRPLS